MNNLKLEDLTFVCDLFYNEVSPQVDKLRLLREQCRYGIFGPPDKFADDDYYPDMNEGLGQCLEEVIDVLDDFHTKVNDLHEERRMKAFGHKTEGGEIDGND